MKSAIFFITTAMLVLLGCHSSHETEVAKLEREIGALPDNWDPVSVSNSCAVRSRICSVTNIQERIRLTKLLFDHFRHEPAWYVTNVIAADARCCRFMVECVDTLWRGCDEPPESPTPEMVIESWRMWAELFDLYEGVFSLTKDIWNNGQYKPPRWEDYEQGRNYVAEWTSRERREAELRDVYEEIYRLTVGVWNRCHYREYIPWSNIRQRETQRKWQREWKAHIKRWNDYQMKWGCVKSWHHWYQNFSEDPSFVCDYRLLPPEYRPAFVKQIQRDFFQRPGMAYVDWDAIPEDFKKGIEVPPAVKAARKKEKDAKSPTGNVK